MLNYKRCICGAVSHPELMSDTARLSPKAFFKDPSDPNHFICSDCYASIAELRHDYLLDDQNKEGKEQKTGDGTFDIVNNPYYETEPLDEEIMESLFYEHDEEVDGLK